jgi:hypothetical protein
MANQQPFLFPLNPNQVGLPAAFQMLIVPRPDFNLSLMLLLGFREIFLR